ncbi:NADH-quinone oxidoreductase subunit A [bacterium]|nr:NADH-quinone oxidoreductase subunit A [bacterium]
MTGAETLLPLLAMLGFASLVAGGALFVGRFLGPRNLEGVKIQPYECGVTVSGNARDKVSVKYYLIAILFLLFDLEVAFLLPLAIAWDEMIALGWITMGLTGFFLFYFVLSLWFEYRSGALEWEKS